MLSAENAHHASVRRHQSSSQNKGKDGGVRLQHGELRSVRRDDIIFNETSCQSFFLPVVILTVHRGLTF